MSNQQQSAKITESPRDAMQGLKYFIPTKDKARYINALLKVGFDIIDFGSFVSPKAIPQFSDITDLLELIDLDNTSTELLSIVGNQKWGEKAADYEKINWLGYPFSVSTTFQKMNLNRTPEESLDTVKHLLETCNKHGKKFRAYLSMAFGNPYGDAWYPDIVAGWTQKLRDAGVAHIAISDTVGLSTPDNIGKLFPLLLKEFSGVEFGFHLHTRKKHLHEKIEAAWNAGCRNFDSVLKGVGGCPLSGYELVGNLDTIELVSFLENKNISHKLRNESLEEAAALASSVFTPVIPIESIKV